MKPGIKYTFISHYCLDCQMIWHHRMQCLCCPREGCGSTNIKNGKIPLDKRG